MSEVVDLSLEKRRRVKPGGCSVPPLLPDKLLASDEIVERLVAMTHSTNLSALDKTLSAIRRGTKSNWWNPAAVRVASISWRIVQVAHEVGMTIPAWQRDGLPCPQNCVQGKD